jgi:hypothetical protein
MPGASLSKEMTEGTDNILQKLSDKDYCTPTLDIRSPLPPPRLTRGLLY